MATYGVFPGGQAGPERVLGGEEEAAGVLTEEGLKSLLRCLEDRV